MLRFLRIDILFLRIFPLVFLTLRLPPGVTVTVCGILGVGGRAADAAADAAWEEGENGNWSKLGGRVGRGGAAWEEGENGNWSKLGGRVGRGGGAAWEEGENGIADPAADAA